MEFWQICPFFRSIFRHEKKVLALVLAFACAFTMFAGAAFTDEADIQAKDAVNMLTALGVIEGYEDGSFNPDGVVTRAEMAKMIFVVRNNTIDDSAYENVTSNLTDITNHWAKGYIKFCESQGIIAGKGNGIFDPDAPVTGTEAAKMLLVLTGYSADKAGLTGANWETNTLRYAGAAGILDGVVSSLSSGLPRQWAAQMIANTLEADRVLWSNDSETFDQILNGGKKETVGQAYMKLCYDYGTLTVVDTDTLTVVINDAYSAENYHDGWTTVQFTKVGANYTDLLGQTVKVMFRDGKTNDVIGVYAISDNTVYNTLMNGVELDGNKIKFGGSSYSVDNTRSINLTFVDADEGARTDTVNISYFNKDGAVNDDQSNGNTSLSEVTFVDSDGNNKIDTAIVIEKIPGEVTYVGSDRITMEGQTYKFADVNVDDEIVADDYAVRSYNLYEDCSEITKADVVTGELSSTKSKTDYDQFEIEGTWYNIANTGDAAQDAGYENVSVGDTVMAYVCNGVVINVDTDDGTGAIPTNIAVVVGNADGGSSSLYGDQVKLRFFDGTLKTVTVDSDGVKGTDTVLGQAYKVSGSDSNTKLTPLENKKYNGYEFVSTLTKVYANLESTPGTSEGEKVEADSSSKLSTIAGKSVSDDATIVLLDSTGNSKLITGKQFKAINSTTSASDLGDLTKAAWATFTKDVNGIERVMLAAVKVVDTDVSGVSYDNYGYVIDDAVNKTNGDVAFTIFDGTETHDVLVESADASDYAKGTLVAYASIDADGYLQDSVNFETMEAISESASDTATAAKIFAGSNKADATNVISIGDNEMNVTADTQVIVVDSDADKADVPQNYTYGTTKLPKAADTGRINVVYRVEDGEAASDGADLELVVIDITGAFDFNRPDSTTSGDDDEGSSSTMGNFTINAASAIQDAQAMLSDKKVVATATTELPEFVTKATVAYTITMPNGFKDSGSVEITSGDITINGKYTVDDTEGKITVEIENPVYTDVKASAGTIAEAASVATGTSLTVPASLSVADGGKVSLKLTPVDFDSTNSGKAIKVTFSVENGSATPTEVTTEALSKNDKITIDLGTIKPDGKGEVKVNVTAIEAVEVD